jgi:hypothetical protein
VGFTRTIEDFDCEQCGHANVGDGYTNHCSACLYSKHVDRSPGDRLHDCGGLMEPVDVLARRTEFVIAHRCTVCGHRQTCRSRPDDNLDLLLRRSPVR